MDSLVGKCTYFASQNKDIASRRRNRDIFTAMSVSRTELRFAVTYLLASPASTGFADFVKWLSDPNEDTLFAVAGCRYWQMMSKSLIMDGSAQQWVAGGSVNSLATLSQQTETRFSLV